MKNFYNLIYFSYPKWIFYNNTLIFFQFKLFAKFIIFFYFNTAFWKTWKFLHYLNYFSLNFIKLLFLLQNINLSAKKNKFHFLRIFFFKKLLVLFLFSFVHNLSLCFLKKYDLKMLKKNNNIIKNFKAIFHW